MKQEVIPAKGHNLKEVPGVAPTFEQEGNIAHFGCVVCGVLFEDAAGENVLAPEDVILEKLISTAEIGGVCYETLEEALNAAKSGDTVKLLHDTVAENVIVRKGVGVDLNGYALTADYVFAVKGTHIVDNSRDNGGVLKVDPNRMMISSGNSDLPIWNGEGFIFVDVLNFQELYTTNAAGQKQYIFLPTFEAIAHQYLVQGMENSRVKIAIRMTWEIDTGSAFQNFVFNDKTVKTIIDSYAGGYYSQAFYATITNSEYADFDLKVVLISDTGVELMCN